MKNALEDKTKKDLHIRKYTSLECLKYELHPTSIKKNWTELTLITIEWWQNETETKCVSNQFWGQNSLNLT